MISALAQEEGAPGEPFLTALTVSRRPPLPFRTAVVVAHPDDETIGCGSLLARLPELTIFHVTDGAPRNGADAQARGFATAEDYAAARRGEVEAAIALAGVGSERLIALGWSDQEASLNMAEIARDLANRVADAEIVLTHAFEGGHPDHDATALAIHAARALLLRRGRAPIFIEMPLYRAGPEGRLAQVFEPIPAGAETVLKLSLREQRLKQAMFAAHASQRPVLGWFTIAVERYRTAPDYDFSRLPNRGNLLYEQQDWGMTGARWLELARSALEELGLGPHL